MHRGKFQVVLIVSLLATCGCATVPHADTAGQERERALLHHRQTETPAATVDVGGYVTHPQAIEIPESGLTLIQAITRAGDIRLFSLENPDTPSPLTFAALQRTSQFTRQTHYIPVALIRQSVLGGVPLREGDVIQVVRYEDTRLSEASRGADNPRFSLSGLVARPREIGIGEDVKFFNDLTKENVAGSFANLGGNLLTVTRATETGLATEHFYLPLKWLGSEEIVQASEIMPNDQITFTSYERLPLVQAALVAGAQRGQQVREKRRRLLAAERPTPTGSSSIPGVDAVQQAGRSFLGIFGGGR
jgi:hypothetical protein